MAEYSPAWPHGSIEEIFENIFFVTGTNITDYGGAELQHSRNMIVIREENELTLIHTVRLNEEGLEKLESLGKIAHIIRLGAFHGRDDAFYQEKYGAKLWAIEGMEGKVDEKLISGGALPIKHCLFVAFETSKFPEGVLFLDWEGGILITCDSIKNWESPDEFFSEATAELYEKQGFFGRAAINKVWLQACQVDLAEFEKIKKLPFKHLLSAHGMPLTQITPDVLKIPKEN